MQEINFVRLKSVCQILKLMIAILCLLAAMSFGQEMKILKIIDEQDQTIKSVQCMVRNSSGSITWEKSKIKAGIVTVDIEELKESTTKKVNGLEMLLMADGYGPEFLRYRFEQIPAEIKLEKSVRVILEKKNKTVAGKPVILPGEYIEEVLYTSRISKHPLRLKKIDSNKWECDLKKGEEYLIGWKAEEGWFTKKFHGYCSEPFIAEKDGQIVNFEPGMPVTFKYDLSKAPKFLNIKKYPVNIRLDKAGPDGGKLHISSVEIKRPGMACIPGIAAGNYHLTAYSRPGNATIPQISDRRVITIKPGKECVIEPVYPVLDTTAEPGDVSIKGVVLDAEQKPIPNKQVSFWMWRHNENKTLITSDIFYKPAKTDSEGKFEFKGVLPGRHIQLECMGKSLFLAKGSFLKNAEVNVAFVIGQKIEKISVGKPFVFPIVRLENNKKKYLNEFKGKIIVLDIWASWCSPCIRSMPKLSELAKQMQSENVKFVTIGTGNDQQAWKNRLDENGWQFLLHTWLDDTINNHAFQFNGSIPFYVIIDQEGIVRAAGNDVDMRGIIREIQERNASDAAK